MGFFDRKFLSKDKLKGFENYQYSCIDSSPIAVYISHPFWNWFVNFYPTWLAPNVLTLTGATLVMSCYFLVAALDYDLRSNAHESPPDRHLPDWLWLVCAVLTFTAHLLDGTDGKQARRLGASNSTGELFDHGLDSWSTVPFTLTIFSVFGLGIFSISPFRLLCVLISVQLVFITTHWEKYNTGILFLSWGYDASQYGLSVFYLLAYFCDHETFQFYVFDGITFAHAFEASFYVCCILSLIMSIYNVYLAYFVTRTGKQQNLFEIVLPMVSPSLLFVVALLWARYSPTGVNDTSPRLFCWTMGVVFSHIAVNLIIDQMSVTRVTPINRMLIVYCAIAVAAIVGIFGAAELAVLWLLAVVLTAAHVYYGVAVVRQLCGHFRIFAFSLDYLQKK